MAISTITVRALLVTLFSVAACSPRLDVDSSYATGSGSDDCIECGECDCDSGSGSGGKSTSQCVKQCCEYKCFQDDPGDNDDCRGECGYKCDGIDGNHFCTPECAAHDDCYRGCIDSGCPTCYPVVCMAACAASWYDAYKSVLECAYGLRDCTCPW
jgi:hypothetical protein